MGSACWGQREGEAGESGACANDGYGPGWMVVMAVMAVIAVMAAIGSLQRVAIL